MMDIRAKVFEQMDSGRICVFPTEVAARFFLIEYARLSEKGMVLDSQAVAWDAFYKNFSPSHPGLKAADLLVRKIFAVSFCHSEKATLLRHFSGLSPDGLASYFARILGQLSLASGHASGDMEADIQLVLDEYSAFLASNRLFEPLYDKAVVPDGFDPSAYVVFFPEAIAGYPLFVHQTGLELSTVGADASDLAADLEVFPNALCELRTQMRRIRCLLDEGVNPSEIIITCLGLDSARPFLEREARRYEIPIDIVQGRTLSEYSAGKFFPDVLNVISSDFSLESVQRLVLCGSYPYKDPKALRTMVSEAMSSRVISGRQDWLSRLSPESKELFEGLSRRITGFQKCRTVDQLRRAFNDFQDNCFISGAFRADENSLACHVYSYCVRLMKQLEKSMSDCGLDGLDGLFALYVRLLGETIYVPQSGQEGIKVYSYPQSAGLAPTKHFVICIDQEAARQETRYVTFLPDSITGDFILDRIDRTNSVLALYSCSSPEVCMSGSETGFSGASLCPPLFLSQNRKKEHVISGQKMDEYSSELDFWIGEDHGFVPNYRQKNGFDAFWQSFLEEICINDVPMSHHKPVLSSKSIDAFMQCPFKFKCMYQFKLEKLDLCPLSVDYIGIGNLIHEVFEQFFLDAGVIDPDCKDEYNKAVIEKYDHQFAKFRLTSSMSETALDFENSVLRKAISEIDFSGLAGFKASVSEKECRKDLDSCSLKGRIDLVFEDPDGNLGVLDLKSASFKAQLLTKKVGLDTPDGPFSVQLLVYNRLLEDDGRKIMFGAYLSVKDSKFYYGWDSAADSAKADSLLDSRLSQMMQSLAEGKLDPTPSTESCKNCEFYPICRRRYVIR
ncbi:MAG: PD-(D/E)XK nuclease family protein [Sphaerochaetaceae bacterium]|nr:PD-(D/E)XK nuclease family protein [Sphaerochaetaceae bacterium]MDD3163026.1 PD-(D/E)XK nuclease family protein [Sphaerochaetaceae bacterium]